MRKLYPHLTRLLLITVLAGCGRTLMPTPALHRDPDVDYFADVPAERRSNTVEILYCTDRSPSSAPGQPLRYGPGRSKSLAIGTTRVRIGGPSLTWEELVAASRTGRRNGRLGLHHLDASELVRMPITPWYVQLVDDPDITEAEVRHRWLQCARDAQEILDDRLRAAGSGDVFVYVHGFNNTFADAAMTLAELWHFLGRPGVAILYSWPAATAGVFGYNPDRESSEYTVSHFKQLIQVVAGSAEVERIHLIAHSRGTEVLASALRELHIHHNAAGLDTSEELKLENALMIAADIDQEVADQRFGAESVWQAARHTTFYTSVQDTALDFASNMFKSRRRMGQLDTDAVSEAGRVVLDYLSDQVTIVHQPRRIGLTGHNYHISDPRASSDLVLLLLGHQLPGAENGRPLEQHPSGVWVIPDGYPEN
ncbi:MAG: alpha/beta hydrolase [Planctomycetota bacterium]|jgi:esterase/lipase superfamily enzyme